MAPAGDIVYLTNNDTYNLWASTYDTDGNVLQAIDNHQILHDLFPSAVQYLLGVNRSSLYITDLGAGTGRASLSFLSTLKKFLQMNPLGSRLTIRLTLLDSSAEMLTLARSKLISAIDAIPADLNLDIVPTFKDFDISSTYPSDAPEADLVFSTLVLEHLPMPTFFSAMAAATKQKAGRAIVTNMHSAMGQTALSTAWKANDTAGSASITGAGFKDADGRKVRVMEDWAHDEDEVEQVARAHGLEVTDQRREVTVTAEMLDEHSRGIKLGERGRKWIGTKVWSGWTFSKP
ncbi:Hypothetical protein D9617_14g076610 [Elsinoe fawcettii]|nr:Hypothetical protein D9617_14g076610 [Elsinoe fawcettii]